MEWINSFTQSISIKLSKDQMNKSSQIQRHAAAKHPETRWPRDYLHYLTNKYLVSFSMYSKCVSLKIPSIPYLIAREKWAHIWHFFEALCRREFYCLFFCRTFYDMLTSRLINFVTNLWHKLHLHCFVNTICYMQNGYLWRFSEHLILSQYKTEE